MSLASSKHVFFIMLYSLHIEIVIKITCHITPVSAFTCTILVANKVLEKHWKFGWSYFYCFCKRYAMIKYWDVVTKSLLKITPILTSLKCFIFKDYWLHSRKIKKTFKNSFFLFITLESNTSLKECFFSWLFCSTHSNLRAPSPLTTLP